MLKKIVSPPSLPKGVYVFHALPSSQALPQLRLPQDGFGFDPDLQQLYAAVTTHGNANARKRKLSEQSAQDRGDPSPQSQDPAPSPGFTPPPGRIPSPRTAPCPCPFALSYSMLSTISRDRLGRHPFPWVHTHAISNKRQQVSSGTEGV